MPGIPCCQIGNATNAQGATPREAPRACVYGGRQNADEARPVTGADRDPGRRRSPSTASVPVRRSSCVFATRRADRAPPGGPSHGASSPTSSSSLLRGISPPSSDASVPASARSARCSTPWRAELAHGDLGSAGQSDREQDACQIDNDEPNWTRTPGLPLNAAECRSTPSSSGGSGCKVVASGPSKAFRGRRAVHKTPAFTPEESGSAYRIRTGVTAVRGRWCWCQVLPPNATECRPTRRKPGVTAARWRRESPGGAACGCRKVANEP